MESVAGKKRRRHFVRTKSTHFFIGFLAFFLSIHVKAKEGPNNGSHTGDRFSWLEHRKLSWSDFKGPVDAQSDESAAATCCSIGFRVNNDTVTGQPAVSVYNTFYISRSWVREDARIGSILDHEQGHFDLCELYTRKLRERITSVDMRSPQLKQELMNIYAAVNAEYEVRQQAYEEQTTHGTIIAEQRRWEAMITEELGDEISASL